jgi:hypothetical protein
MRLVMDNQTYPAQIQHLNTQDHRVAQIHEETLPTFIYSTKNDTDLLHRTSLVTGERSSHRVLSYQFKIFCGWSEVPGGSLLITGGGIPAVNEVVRIDTRREFAAFEHPPMHTARSGHGVVYHAQHLYVLGGYSRGAYLGACERFVCADNQWQELPPLPYSCCDVSAVVLGQCLYALGGDDGEPLDQVQRLILECLTWQVMKFQLPFAGCGIPCFKVSNTEVYLVVKQRLCSLTAKKVQLLRKTLTESIFCYCGPSYYRRGTLYCSSNSGEVSSQEIGSLSN